MHTPWEPCPNPRSMSAEGADFTLGVDPVRDLHHSIDGDEDNGKGLG